MSKFNPINKIKADNINFMFGLIFFLSSYKPRKYIKELVNIIVISLVTSTLLKIRFDCTIVHTESIQDLTTF